MPQMRVSIALRSQLRLRQVQRAQVGRLQPQDQGTPRGGKGKGAAVTYRIKNWAQFQHYKDRAPQWIKLYRELLDDVDFHLLAGDDAKRLMLLWLLAAEDEANTGTLPDVRKIAFRLRISEQDASKTLARLSHWVEQPASNLLAEPEQPASLEKRREEREEETEESARARRSRVVPVPCPEEVSPDIWEGWLAIRKAKRAPVSEAALELLREEAEKAGWTVQAALKECVARGWQGFKAEWVNKPTGGAGSFGKPSRPVPHIVNMPLGTPSCDCEDCVSYRAKRAVTA